MATFERYGIKWKGSTQDAFIERHMIRNGGQWEEKGEMFGNGLIYHFKKYWEYLWPMDDQTWWTDLILKEVMENQFTSVVGGASAWKTGTIARIALMDWSVFPECTTVITSSTTLEGLKSRVFGEMIMLWKKAFEITGGDEGWFPGHCVDSKCVITHDNVELVQARDIRNSIVGVACKTSSGKFVGMGCFVRGTMVDTPYGPRPIEELKSGDWVVNATGHSRIRETMVKQSPSLVKLKFDDGSEIICTPDHPFLTSEGWECAIDLKSHHRLISSDETLSILQEADAKLSREQEVLFRAVRNGELQTKMQGVPESFHPERCERDFLLSVLRIEMEVETAGNCRSNGCRERFGTDGSKFEQVFTGQSKGDVAPIHSRKEEFQVPEISVEKSRGVLPDKRGVNYSGNFSGINLGISSENGFESKKRKTELLPLGRGLAGFKTGRGIGWDVSQRSGAENKRLNPNEVFRTKRLASVEILEQGNKVCASESTGGYTVYNIEVENHPSYSVQGLIVHNSYAGRKNRRVWCVGDEFQFMETSIMDGQKNLVSNGPNLVPALIRNKEDKEFGLPQRGYKCVFIGNTNPSRPGNPLDVVSEPEKGWGSIPEDGKTKVWKCKQLPDHPIKCTCINLDSMDSPNSEYPIDKPRWVHLAGPHKLALYREGSESYWSQGRGVFKFGLAEFKFITRQICEQHHALDGVIWMSTGQTKIGMMDAAYGAGDRCALGWLEFGKCQDGKVRLLFREMWLVPIIIRPDMKPEDQIAVFCKQKMESVGVPPENFFFDGRGSMAMSLASIWSPKVNALEFGGVPSERPAGPDIFIDDPKIGRRLKTEREHFSKKVTALWWGWKYVIEADQMRGLTEEIISDAAPREWYYVANNKIEAETKAEMKKRTGLSPDLADMMVSGVEGARQRGFETLKLSIATTTDADENYFDDEVKAWDAAIKSGLLKH
jgi:hypothetical protein